MKTFLLSSIFFFTIANLSFCQNLSEDINYMIQFLDKNPKAKDISKIESFSYSEDTLILTLATCILFKNNTSAYKTQMMDIFEIPYENWKFSKEKKYPSNKEITVINNQIQKNLSEKYGLSEKESEKIKMLYTFIIYRKHNVWKWKSENFAIPITTAIRGGFLRSLLNESMDYKKFISEMQNRNKDRSIKN